MILWGKRSVSPEGVSLDASGFGASGVRAPFVHQPKVESRLKQFRRAVDLRELETSLELAELKDAFERSTENTLNLLRTFRQASWRNSHIRGGSLGDAKEAFEELKATFNSEAQDKIRRHPEYPAISKEFDEKVKGLAEKDPHRAKLRQKFEHDTEKLLDGTICWYMGKFIEKMDVAFEPRHKEFGVFVPLKPPKEVRSLVMNGIQILEMGLTAHFPSAFKKPDNS